MSPAFAALVRKERLFLAAFLLVALAAGVLALVTEGFEKLFVRGSDEALLMLALVQVPIAVLAGAWLGLREEVTRTSEFLRQRPLAPELPPLACGLSGALVAFVAPLGAGLLLYLHDLVFVAGGVGLRPETWLALAQVGACALASFGASFLAGSLPTSWLARAVALFLLLVAQLTLQSWLGSVLSGRAWLLALLLYGAALLGAARAAAGRERDLDRPPGMELLTFPLALLTLVSLLFGGLTTAGWQKLASRELAETRPSIGWTTDGRLVRCAWVGKPGSFAIVDASGTPTGEELDDDQPRVVPARHTLHGIRPLPVADVSSQWVFRYAERELRLLTDARGTRWIESERDGRRRTVRELVGPGVLGDPRALHTFETGADDEHVFVFAPGAELWRVRADEPHLERVELPGGARPTGTTHFFGTGDDFSLGRALDTTDGAWFYRDGAWVRPDPELYHQPRLTSELVDPDPLTPTQRVTGPGGVTLDVPHPLDTLGKKTLAALMGLSAVVRPPPLALLSATLDYEAAAAARPDEFLVLFDPLLGGGHAWWLVPNVLLHVGLAWSVAREFARRGLEPARRRRWILAFLLGGIWIAAWAAALETRRAWKKSRSGPAPAPLVHAA